MISRTSFPLAPSVRRKLRFVVQTTLMVSGILAIFFGRDRILPSTDFLSQFANHLGPTVAGEFVNKPLPWIELTLPGPPLLSADNVTTFLTSILDPDSAVLPRLECPAPDMARYEPLIPTNTQTTTYFFALNLRQSLPILPRLLGTLIATIRFLGPTNCALSIVEGNSDDGTPEILSALIPSLTALGVRYHVVSSRINPSQGARVPQLATLRNLSLKPLLDDRSRFSENATVIFLNDVVLCPEDILELLHQRVHLGADMTCAMDWTYVGRDPTFYDVWIARTIQGNSFFEIPPDGNWNSAWNLFWNEPETQARYYQHQPFQVFSCWNGAAAFTAKPILGGTVSFRGPREEECMQGEPQLFCKDMWASGHGKIAVVPGVSLEYSDQRGREIKALKGYTSQWRVDVGIEWKGPPDKVRCMASYEKQFWEPWNVSFPG
ncbi:hypothetical protein OQA88_5199 [Cercophora sp. LCS_1]